MDGYQNSVEGQEILRRRKLLEALGQQSAASPLVGASGPTQAVAKMLTQVLLDRKGQKLSEEFKAGNTAYGDNLSKETSAYINQMMGKPGEVMSDQQASALMLDDQAPQLAEPVRANPREAITRAMTSRMPEMQQLGKAGMAEIAARGKQDVETFGTDPKSLQGPDGKLVVALLGNRGTVKEVPGYSPAPNFTATAGGHLYDNTTGTPKGYVGPKFGEVGVVANDADGKPMVGQRELTSGKVESLDKRNSVSVRNNVSAINSAQKAGFEEWSKSAAKAVGELAEQARGATKVLSQANQLEKLNDAGVVQGPLANPAVWLGQLATSAGIQLSPEARAKLQNSETFNNTATELWLATMNANGGSRGLVKEESERIAASLPALMQTPDGRRQIIAVTRAAAKQRIDDAKTAQQEYGKALQSQNPQEFTYGLGATQLPNPVGQPAAPGSFATPATTGGAAQPRMSLDEYLNRGK